MKKQPLEFANIVLFSLPDFTFLQGTISDKTGAFNIKSQEIITSLIYLYTTDKYIIL